MNDEQIEQEIQDKGLTAPRVTPERIADVITGEFYFTAEDGVVGKSHRMPVEGAQIVHSDLGHPLKWLTFCVLTLRNGFTVTGESACAHPANFDAELGRKIARQKAIEKIWMLEGYLLRETLAGDAAS